VLDIELPGLLPEVSPTEERASYTTPIFASGPLYSSSDRESLLYMSEPPPNLNVIIWGIFSPQAVVPLMTLGERKTSRLPGYMFDPTCTID
jgi:hypothetical protein